MTWVVGNATVDLGVLVGDIRITWMAQGGRTSEETRFGVQRLHMIAPNLCAGFAGSIPIGFEMVERLRRVSQAAMNGRERPEPETVISRWRDEVVGSYESDFSEDLRKGGCHLLVLGASQRWTELNGRLLFRTTRLFLLEFPTLGHSAAEFAELQWNRFHSIGSGSQVDEYCRLLDGTYANGGQGLLAFAPASNQGFGEHMLFAGYLTSLGMGTVIDKSPTPGISANLLTAVVTGDGTYFGSNEGAHLALPKEGSVAVPPMPPLARNRFEFDALVRQFPLATDGVAIG